MINCEVDVSDNQKLEQVLLENNARWHKSCRDKFNSTKLGRVKRKVRDKAKKEKDDEGALGETVISSPVKAK